MAPAGPKLMLWIFPHSPHNWLLGMESLTLEYCDSQRAWNCTVRDTCGISVLAYIGNGVPGSGPPAKGAGCMVAQFSSFFCACVCPNTTRFFLFFFLSIPFFLVGWRSRRHFLAVSDGPLGVVVVAAEHWAESKHGVARRVCGNERPHGNNTGKQPKVSPVCQIILLESKASLVHHLGIA